jgi:hypothetical protein
MKWLGILGVVVVVAAFAYQALSPSATIRYRMTLEVSVNGEPKIGSGVIEVSYDKNLRILGASADLVIEVDGEAVSVDLGEGDALFALLTPGRHPRSGPEYVIPVLFNLTTGGFGSEDIGRISVLNGRREIPSELLPLMVRLRNLRDPKSAELFDPSEAKPSPDQGLKLTRATIEIVGVGMWPLNLLGITGAPISHGIAAKLPWLMGFKGLTGGQPNIDQQRPERNLTGSDFIKGTVQ